MFRPTCSLFIDYQSMPWHVFMRASKYFTICKAPTAITAYKQKAKLPKPRPSLANSLEASLN
jgi:hypothetical protein